MISHSFQSCWEKGKFANKNFATYPPSIPQAYETYLVTGSKKMLFKNISVWLWDYHTLHSDFQDSETLPQKSFF